MKKLLECCEQDEVTRMKGMRQGVKLWVSEEK